MKTFAIFNSAENQPLRITTIFDYAASQVNREYHEDTLDITYARRLYFDDRGNEYPTQRRTMIYVPMRALEILSIQAHQTHSILDLRMPEAQQKIIDTYDPKTERFSLPAEEYFYHLPQQTFPTP